jgi:hypothetical protein
MADSNEGNSMKFTIKRRWLSSLPAIDVEIDASFDGQAYGIQLGAAIKIAVKTGADLTGADLTRAVLRGADLTGAVLTDAVLTRAVLTRADLTGADLTGADLTRAVLRGADLTGAVLTDADLTGADLTDADLTGAVLTRAVLTDADLRSFKADLWMTLTQNRAEVPGLIAALRDGRVDGSTYEGECACLVGTIAKTKAVSYSALEHDPSNPAERWFSMIKAGDKPGDTTGGGFAAQKALDWALEWCALNDVTIADAMLAARKEGGCE